MQTNPRTTVIAVAGLTLCAAAAANGVRAQNPFPPQMNRVPGPMEHVRWATMGEAGVGFGSIVLGKPLPKKLPPVSQEGSVSVWQSFTVELRQRSVSEPWGRGSKYQNALDIVTRGRTKETAVVEEIRIAGFSPPGEWQEPSISGYSIAEHRLPRSKNEKLRLPKTVQIGDSERDVLRAFPAATRATTFFCMIRKAKIDVYDDKAQGIAFEIQAWQGAEKGSKPPRLCSGIVIHRRGKSVFPVAIEQMDWKTVPRIAPPV